MITCRRFDPTGKYLGTVALDLKKSAVYTRLIAAVNSEQPGITYKSVEQMDAGTLPLNVLARVFSRGEIERAIARRVSALEVESQELRVLQELLANDMDFAAAAGGEQAVAHGFPSPGRVAKSRRSR